mmetsp:Transcript_45749/g.102451  ORF Transcript_45749/g.102451 Transcript_45749/m.102451 type:complete len:417 (+) Transcript_45749:38-1288(+)
MSNAVVADPDFAGFAQSVLQGSFAQGDFTIEVQEKCGDELRKTEFKVWSVLLMTASPVFDRMIRDRSFSESVNGRVVINDFSTTAVEAFLRLLHAGSTEGGPAIFLEVSMLADKYAVEKIQRLAGKAAAEALKPETACHLFQVADRFHHASLRRAALEAILTCPFLALQSRPALPARLVREVLACEALCIDLRNLKALVEGWEPPADGEEQAVQNLFETYLDGTRWKFGRTFTKDILESLSKTETTEFFLGFHVNVILGPADKNWRATSSNQHKILTTLATGRLAKAPLSQDGWIAWMLPHASIYLTGLSFSEHVGSTCRLRLEVLSSEDGVAWQSVFDSGGHVDLRAHEDVSLEHRRDVKWVKLVLHEGCFKGSLMLHGVLIQPASEGTKHTPRKKKKKRKHSPRLSSSDDSWPW